MARLHVQKHFRCGISIVERAVEGRKYSTHLLQGLKGPTWVPRIRRRFEEASEVGRKSRVFRVKDARHRMLPLAGEDAL